MGSMYFCSTLSFLQLVLGNKQEKKIKPQILQKNKNKIKTIKKKSETQQTPNKNMGQPTIMYRKNMNKKKKRFTTLSSEKRDLNETIRIRN